MFLACAPGQGIFFRQSIFEPGRRSARMPAAFSMASALAETGGRWNFLVSALANRGAIQVSLSKRTAPARGEQLRPSLDYAGGGPARSLNRRSGGLFRAWSSLAITTLSNHSARRRIS